MFVCLGESVNVCVFVCLGESVDDCGGELQ